MQVATQILIAIAHLVRPNYNVCTCTSYKWVVHTVIGRHDLLRKSFAS